MNPFASIFTSRCLEFFGVPAEPSATSEMTSRAVASTESQKKKEHEKNLMKMTSHRALRTSTDGRHQGDEKHGMIGGEKSSRSKRLLVRLRLKDVASYIAWVMSVAR